MKLNTIIKIAGMVLIVIAVGTIIGERDNYTDPITISYAFGLIKGFVMLLIGIFLAFDVYKLLLKKNRTSK